MLRSFSVFFWLSVFKGFFPPLENYETIWGWQMCSWWSGDNNCLEMGKMLSRSVVSDSLRPVDCSLPGSLCPWDFPGKKTRVGCHFLLQGIFPTQGLILHLMNCRQILYHLSHQGSQKWDNKWGGGGRRKLNTQCPPLQPLTHLILTTPWNPMSSWAISMSRSAHWGPGR